MDPVFTIDECCSGEDVARCRELFAEYASSLGISLDFQGFDEELSSLPGSYVPPRGALLLARQGADLAGCIALRPLDLDHAEIKRLYVRPHWRGEGLGQRLVEAVCARAKAAGYRAVRLDTLASMLGAMRLYKRLGFIETPPYHDATRPGMRFFQKAL